MANKACVVLWSLLLLHSLTKTTTLLTAVCLSISSNDSESSHAIVAATLIPRLSLELISSYPE